MAGAGDTVQSSQHGIWEADKDDKPEASLEASLKKQNNKNSETKQGAMQWYT